MKKTMRDHMRERFGGTVSSLSNHPDLPNSLNIELNNICNQRCEFCGFHGKYKNVELIPYMMEFEFAKKILNQAWELGIGIKELGFYLSGEVFLHPDFSKLVQYAKNLGFPYTFITTNGALATKDKIIEVLNAGLDSIRFSVNAADRDMYYKIHGTDDFDKVVDNIRFTCQYIKEKNLKVATSISCVVSKRQGDDLQKNIREIFGDLVDDILFIPIILQNLRNLEEVKSIYGENYIDEDASINKNFICPVIFNSMYVYSDGRVIPCCNAPYTSYNVYNLHDKLDLREAWYSDGYVKLRKIFTEGENDIGTICEDCLLRKQGVNRLTIEERL